MLYVEIRGKGTNKTVQLGWHTGGPVVPELEAAELHRVVRVQADGDELSWVLDECRGIRVNRQSVVSWYGDDARFIAHTLYQGQRSVLSEIAAAGPGH